ncbi:hypothetical protein IPJ70_02730 [Candidatus Campbellbacteria bacterium]|nr:MAG: hypothetical protein IPJ70_02730 [Candidatus Campbellbacteria bacterium]
MKYQEYIQYIDKEIDHLNWVIDEKIMQGISYRAEAKRHKELIQWARRNRRPSLFKRLGSVMALF